MPDQQANHTIDDKVTALGARDPGFARAAPSPSVADAIRRSDGSLIGTISAAMTGYQDRPALAQRATRPVRDTATGRRALEILPEFKTLTYGELWARARTLASAWAHCGVGSGDFVAALGFTSIDYATIHLACMYSGAVSVSLAAESSPAQLAPIITETQPRILAAGIGSVTAAVETVVRSRSIERLVVFDYDPRADDHQQALADAVRVLGGRAAVETLHDTLTAGNRLPAAPPCADRAPDRLAALIYTSGSTGTPKGVMYTASMITAWWQDRRDPPVPMILMHHFPMSHASGPTWLIAGLASGGTGFFAARSDMPSLLDNMRRSRPTVLLLVPRICDMVYHQYLLEADRISGTGVARPDAEAAALIQVRDRVLGGRVLSARCGGAPLSPATRAFMTSVLGTDLENYYGATEIILPLVINQRVCRPAVLDYRLADVPELGYFTTDKPHPRGELRVKSAWRTPGYYQQPEATANAFDEDGYYKTGDVFAEIGPDRLTYIDRVNNVVKLSQGEFVAISQLEAFYSTSPYIAQTYLYGRSDQAFLLAVVVPGHEQLAQADERTAKATILGSMRELARKAGLPGYEIPYDIIIETVPFTIENGLLGGFGKLQRASLKARYATQLEQLYTDIGKARLSQLTTPGATGASAEPLEAVLAAVQTALGRPRGELRPENTLSDLGGDSISAHAFSTALEQISGHEVPVQVILSPGSTLALIAERIGAVARRNVPTFALVHGSDPAEVKAADLSPGRFIDEQLLVRPSKAPERTGPAPNILLTGATGHLGRFLAIEWLHRITATGGQLIVLARAADNEAARNRVLQYLRAAVGNRADWLDGVAADHLKVLAADVSAPRLDLDDTTWERTAAETDQIVHAAALVNHVLPYRRLFSSNVAATSELIRLALTRQMKPFTYISTIGAAMEPGGSVFDEMTDVRSAASSRPIDDSDANGYTTSKWAGEVLLRETHDRTGLPVSVFRPDAIMAHSRVPGQINLPDRFTRLILSVVATAIAPRSFYRLDTDGSRQRAHFSGMPVDFTAEAIASLGAPIPDGYVTYNTVNANDDGISLDTIVDWLIAAGHSITRFDDYEQWRIRFEAAMRGLPPLQRRLSLLPLLSAYARPAEPTAYVPATATRFTAAVSDLRVRGGSVPSISPEFISKCVADLKILDIL